MTYREDQKSVMKYEGGYMAVPSVPGAGKTFILTHLAAKLIEEKKSNILILTYMTSAVSNFRGRITRLLEERNIAGNKKLDVMTIHSLAMKILRHSHEKISISEGFEMADTYTKKTIIKSAIIDWKIKNRAAFEWFIEKNYRAKEKCQNDWEDKLCEVIEMMIGEFKNRELYPIELKALLKQNREAVFLKIAAEIYDIYDIKLKRDGLLDFDDLLISAYRILKGNEGVKEYFQNKYDYIFEDEAQDSNILQGKILKLLSERSGNLVKVGDSNQSILSTFTSSDPKLFKLFYTDSRVTVNKLFDAGRSAIEIIDFANFFVKWFIKEHPIEVCRDALEEQYISPISGKGSYKNPVNDKFGIFLQKSKTFEEEIKYVIDFIRGYKNKYPKKSIAILASSAYLISLITEQMLACNIEFEELSDFSRENSKVTTILGRLLDYVADPINNKKLLAMAETIFIFKDYENGEVFKKYLLKVELDRLIFPVGGRLEEGVLPDDIAKSQIWLDFYEKIIKLVIKVVEFPQVSIEQLLLYVSDLLEFNYEAKAIVQKVVSDLSYLLMLNPKWMVKNIAEELLEIKNNKFSYFSRIVYELKGYEPSSEKVTIATYHKSKGLEWDCVFLVGVNSANFPAKLSDKFRGEHYYLREGYDNPGAVGRAEIKRFVTNEVTINPIMEAREENIEERARLLYVGITRARQFLVMTTAERDPWDKEIESFYFDVLNEYYLKKKGGNELLTLKNV